MFKIESLKLSETAEMLLKHPATGEVLEDDDGQPIVFHLFGTSSREHRKALDAILRANKKRGGRGASLAETREENLEYITAMTDKIENMEYPEGQALDTPEAIKELYRNPQFSWIVEAVNVELTSVDSFLQR